MKSWRCSALTSKCFFATPSTTSTTTLLMLLSSTSSLNSSKSYLDLPNCSTWFARGFVDGYFKTFGLTKYICKMIVKCVSTCRRSSRCCATWVFAFMFIFQAASFEFKTADLTLMQTFEMSFMIIIGIFKFDGWIFEIQLIMNASILLNQIRMLNLFLAFFWDVFAKVKAGSILGDTKAMIDLLLEVSYRMFWRRQSGCKNYLQVCT